jgi:hypothetical protein
MTPTIPPLIARTVDPAGVDADWLIVFVAEGEALSATATAMDARLGGALERLRQGGDITGKVNETVAVLTPSGVAARRVLVAGLGKQSAIDRGVMHDAAAAAARLATGKSCARIAAVLPDDVPVADAALAVGVGSSRGALARVCGRRHPRDLRRRKSCSSPRPAPTRRPWTRPPDGRQRKAGLSPWPANWSTRRRATCTPRASPTAPARLPGAPESNVPCWTSRR